MWNRESSNTHEPTPAPSQTPPAVERRTIAWVGKSVIFRGDLISSEDMTIDGRVEGTIEVRDHHLTIGPNSSIAADVVARSVTIFGEVMGTIAAEEKVEIRVGSSVEGDLSCQTLAIQEGAHFCGKVSMKHARQQAEPDRPASIAATA
jgi:cytoskeletal protein CcmA (bactofilin family)